MDVDEYHCPPSEKPKSEKQCNMTSCPEVKIKAKRMKFFQVNKLDKVSGRFRLTQVKIV